MSDPARCVSTRSPSLARRAGLWFFALWLFPGLVIAQTRLVVIQNATVLTGEGRALDHADVAFQGGKITAVGSNVEAGLLAKKIAADGKYITPGLIDVDGTIALRFNAGGNQASARAIDAFDDYADDEIEDALREGITTVYLPARCANGIGGLGSVRRLVRGVDSDERVLRSEAALCAAIAADGRSGPLARVKTAAELRRRLHAAKEYREAREDYEEDLKEYEDKLAERVKKEAAAEKAEQKESKKEGKQAAAPSNKRKRGKRGAAKNDEKKEELKKPAEPKKDRDAEVLLRVLDGELYLRVEAHYPADILNVLQIADEYNVALIIEGATGAYEVADRLADSDVPVVLTDDPAPVLYTSGAARYAEPENAALLRQAGVDVYFGSGALGSQTAVPRLALRVARAVGNGFDADAALQTITYRAAQLLGIDKEVGRVKHGLKADLVIWSDHPFAPGARVERVFIGGKEVFNADSAPGGRRK